MAVTKLIAVASQGRGKTSKSGIAATIDYVCNPAKTNHGECVSGFGCKLADELLQGRFQYVVSTHQDKEHIHNHIIFNSVSFVDGKKFHGVANIFNKIADISDSLCWEYGLSIVEERQAKGKSYAEHSADKQGQSWKSKLREILDDCIRRAKDWEEFLQLMREAECEIKFGKHICFRHKEQQRFTRGKTLGLRYTEDKIKSQLRGIFIDINAPQNQSSYQPKVSLVYDIEKSVKAKQSEGLKHWMEIQNLKMAAMTIN